jgi:predicted metal-dependent phosphoesterase TrpH
MHDAELHCHTLYSKGTVQPIECQTTITELLETAKKRGLHMIAITDHNTMAGYFAAVAQAKQMGITLIPAEEIDIKEGGHILAYGIRKAIRPFQAAHCVVQQIHAQGGIAVVAHPYDILHPMNALEDIIDDVDGAEFVSFGTLNNRKAQKKLNQRIRSPLCIAGSDAHSKRLIGALRMEFSDECKTPDEYLSAMRRHQCTIRVAMPYGVALFWGFVHIIHMAIYNLMHKRK